MNLTAKAEAWWYGWTCKSIFHIISLWLVEHGDRMTRCGQYRHWFRPQEKLRRSSLRLSGCSLRRNYWCCGSKQMAGIIRGPMFPAKHWIQIQLFFSAAVQLPVYRKMSWRLLITLKWHLLFVYPLIHAITVCSLIAERKDQCKQSRWKAYGSEDNSRRIELYRLVLQTGWAMCHNSSTVDVAWQLREQQTCHSVVNHVTCKVTLCKGWQGGGNELRV